MNNRLNYVVMPMLGNWDESERALRSLLEQNVKGLKILAIDQGRHCMGPLQRLAQEVPDRVETWHPSPAMPSLAATWNAALTYVWAVGGTHALVVNNDAVFRETTYEDLLRALKVDPKALFISAYGVHDEASLLSAADIGSRGGPDFSCFLITKECHDKYKFDEGFVPAYCEDVDYHRRLLLGEDGKRIYSIGLCFWHREGGSGTLRAMDSDMRAQLTAAINAGSRKYYEKKWGGAVNDEQFVAPFGDPYPFADEEDAIANPITTPALFEEIRRSWTTQPTSPSASASTETSDSKTSQKTTSSGSSPKSTSKPGTEPTSQGSTSKSSKGSSRSRGGKGKS